MRAAAADDPDLGRLVEAIERYREEAHLGLTLEMAFRVWTPPGQRPWFTRSLVDRRAELVAELAALFGGSVRSAAQAIVAAAHRFETRVWPRWRTGAPVPRDQCEALLLELHRLAETPGGPRWPLSDRQLRNLLGNETEKLTGETARASAAI